MTLWNVEGGSGTARKRWVRETPPPSTSRWPEKEGAWECREVRGNGGEAGEALRHRVRRTPLALAPLGCVGLGLRGARRDRRGP